MISKLFLTVLTVLFMAAMFIAPVFAEEAEVTLIISPAGESDAGADIFFEATAEGIDDPEYQFGYRRVGGSWTARTSGPDNTYERSVPAGYRGGEFELGVRVREAGTTEWLDMDTVLHTIKPVEPSVTLTVTPSRQSELGDVLTLTASSEGVSNPEFRFGRRYTGGSWAASPWSTTVTREHSPGQLGAMDFGVQVREAGGSWLAVDKVAHEVVEEILGRIFDETGTYGPEDETAPETIEGDVIVKAGGVTLKNFIITGDLIITEEVGDGEVTLNNLEVKGELIIRGGGAESIYVNGGQYSKIRIEEVDGEVRVVAVGVTGPGGEPVNVVVAEGAIGEEIFLDGDFDEIIIDADSSKVNICATVDVVNINASGVTVKLCSTAVIDHMIINGENATVQGDGTVNTASVNADGARFQEGVIDSDDVTVGDGVEVDPVYFDPEPEPEPTYTVTIEVYPEGSGKVTGAGEYSAGTTVTITATEAEDYYFFTWGSKPAVEFEDERNPTTTFVMPAEPVKVTALFSYGDPIG